MRQVSFTFILFILIILIIFLILLILPRMETGSVALVYREASTDLSVEVRGGGGGGGPPLVEVVRGFKGALSSRREVTPCTSSQIVGWKGKISLRAYVPRNDRMHYVR